ncbi:hypothetical protein BRETT_004215 [Brettanomyces bruxellensis]|uniref:Uncharacterized protein n=1 Tax=Dekkera bruxellensis TaxID=5007 RepID=A0A871R2N5_DEKBR|nr:uncharacterized protein BRETT_004215 [Brettanomyces bruxellensis]QOU18994.1 hypothetical protein BRETT_004215 [Brettanomyces bruxellensis]
MSTYENLRLSTYEQQALYHFSKANGDFSPQSTQNSTPMSSVQDELDFRHTSRSPSSQTTTSSNSADANMNKSHIHASPQLSRALDISSLGFYSGPSLNNSMISSKRHAQFVRRSIVISPSLNSIHSLTGSSSCRSNLSSQATEVSEAPTATIAMVNSPSIRALSDILNNNVDNKTQKFDAITEEDEQLNFTDSASTSSHLTSSGSFTSSMPHTPSPKARRPICHSPSSTNLSPQRVEAIKANLTNYSTCSGAGENQPDLISLTSTPKSSSCSTLQSPTYSPPAALQESILRCSPAHSPRIHSPVDHKVGTPIQFGISDESSVTNYEQESRYLGSPHASRKAAISPAISIGNRERGKFTDSTSVKEGDLLTPKLFSPDLVFDEPIETFNVLKNESSASEPPELSPVKEIGYSLEKDTSNSQNIEDRNTIEAYEKFFRLHFSSYDGEPLDRKIDALERLGVENERSEFVQKTEKHHSMKEEQKRLSIRLIQEDSDVDDSNSESMNLEKKESGTENYVEVPSTAQKDDQKLTEVEEVPIITDEQTVAKIAEPSTEDVGESNVIRKEQKEEEEGEIEAAKPLPALPKSTTVGEKNADNHSSVPPASTKKDLRFKGLFSSRKSNAKGVDSVSHKLQEHSKENVDNGTAGSSTQSKKPQRRSMFSEWGRRSFSFVHNHGESKKEQKQEQKKEPRKELKKDKLPQKPESSKRLVKKQMDIHKLAKPDANKETKGIKGINEMEETQSITQKSSILVEEEKGSQDNKIPVIKESQSPALSQSTKTTGKSVKRSDSEKTRIADDEIIGSPASQQLSFASSIKSSSKIRFGDSLFPKTLSNTEVESIVSLERSRSKASRCSYSVSPVITSGSRLTPTQSVDSIVKRMQDSNPSLEEVPAEQKNLENNQMDSPEPIDAVVQPSREPIKEVASSNIQKDSAKGNSHRKQKKKTAGLGISHYKKLRVDNDISDVMNSVNFSDDDEPFDTNFYLSDVRTSDQRKGRAGHGSGRINNAQRFMSLPNIGKLQGGQRESDIEFGDNSMHQRNSSGNLKGTTLFEGLSPSVRTSLKSETKSAILGSLAGTSSSYNVGNEDGFDLEDIYDDFENEDENDYVESEDGLDMREPEVDFFKTGVSFATNDNEESMLEEDYNNGKQQSPKRLSLISRISSSKSSLKSKSSKFASPPLSMHSFAKSPSTSLCRSNMQSALSKKPLGKRRSKQGKRKSHHVGVKFSSEVVLCSTYGDDEYDRHPGNAACNNLTPELAMNIRNELNVFKAEMEVNEHSRCYTHFL